jgi:hypothetical protein
MVVYYFLAFLAAGFFAALLAAGFLLVTASVICGLTTGADDFAGRVPKKKVMRFFNHCDMLYSFSNSVNYTIIYDLP